MTEPCINLHYGLSLLSSLFDSVICWFSEDVCLTMCVCLATRNNNQLKKEFTEIQKQRDPNRDVCEASVFGSKLK